MSGSRSIASCSLLPRQILSRQSLKLRNSTTRSLATFRVPTIVNEPNHTYAKGSEQRKGLQAALNSLKASLPVKIPQTFEGKNPTTDNQHIPSSHAEVLAQYSNASEQDVSRAITSALAAKPAWETLPFQDRAAIFLKAADLIAGKYRYEIMAATMIGQGKNAWQAEIDAAAELADFLRFNVKYAEELYDQQPKFHAPGVWNRSEYRPLEGFVYAISPFNFTAIGGNLAAAPALMGNVVLWKPSPHAVYSNYLTQKIFLEAGLPKDVIQFVPGDAEMVTKVALQHKEFASLHYTGSTAVFRKLYGEIAQNVASGTYRSYPRIVGETGGKNFHLIHKTADIESAALNTIRGAFEFQGQKCSATSRAYVPKSRWEEFKTHLVKSADALKMGPPEEFSNFIGPVIHEASFKKLSGVIDAAKNDPDLTLLSGGKHDKSKGYFVTPTIYQTKDPMHKVMTTEFFGPILAIYVYDDAPANAFGDMCKTIDTTTEYGLTGAVFAKDRDVLRFAENALRHSAGNFYLNVKSTGAVVAQQPFGGARASGTNDKAGSANLTSRFVNIRSIKEEFVGCYDIEYPSNKC